MNINKENKKILGIKELRDLLDLNLEELAVSAGLTQGHLNNIEKHNRVLTMETSIKLAEALSNILEKVKTIGIREKETDSKVRDVGLTLFGNVHDEEESLDAEQIKTKITPELLIASHNASFFGEEKQERAYDLLLEIERKKLYLKFIETNGIEALEEYQLLIEELTSNTIGEIMMPFLSDPHLKIGLWGIKEELQDYMRSKDGYFLSKHDQSR